MKTSLTRPLAFAALLLGGATLAASGMAVRELPYDFHPGDLIAVRIQVTPPPGITNWMVRERYPDRWDLVSVTNASATNEFLGELVFGPFAGDAPQTLTYEVLSNPGLTNSVHFTGEVTMNALIEPVAGSSSMPSRNEWMFAGPQSLNAERGVSGVAYGAGRWLASSDGWITTLEAGGRLTYPRMQRWHGEGWSRLAHAGGLFLLFGASPDGTPQMTVSDDGLAWKAALNEAGHPNPFVNGGYVRSVAHGNGAYVAVGDQWFAGEQPAGAVFYSTNGYHWKRVSRLANPWRNIVGITYAQDRFIAVATYGTLLTSTNGLDWTETRPITDPGNTDSVWMNRHLLGVCHGPSGWIIPTSASGVVLRSADGLQWEEVNITSTARPASEYWQTFHADGRYWFSTYTEAFTTVDGTAWVRDSSLPSPTPSGPVSRAPDGVTPQYLGAGTDYASLVTSSNGSNWSLEVPGGWWWLPWPRYSTVACINNEWVVSGQSSWRTDRNGPTDRPGKIWVPNFGGLVLSVRDATSRWRKASLGATPGVWADHSPAPNGLVVAGASRAQLWAGLLVGTNYQAASATFLPALERFVGILPYKGLPNQNWEFANASLAVTPDGFELYTDSYSLDRIIRWGHFTSTDGSTWTRRSLGLNDVTNFPGIRGLAWGAGRFVAVSEGSTPGTSGTLTTAERIFTSTDGENYTPVNLSGLSPSLNGEGLTGVAYAAGRFVAVGASGRILSSTNGLDWVSVRTGSGPRWNRVRYLEGTWAAVGNAGWVAFSPDGETWTSKTSGVESDLTDIAHQRGSYMAVGSHAMVLVSLPGTPTIASGSVAKLPGAGLTFSITGQPGQVLDIQVSPDLLSWTSRFLITNATGTVTVQDPDPSGDRRFYRAIQLP